ncbi:SurA N-terminal domain-containing protein [Oceanobacillus manasiensis]|uniref:SurA N-terminal domain-containing protein n=1 Tax=Oceanobacillus manasiensis TaxID=586413 RepID=UPI0005A7565D|nr:SurA N-terminal domain-containing protein [Oceanobacillus manasiensis]
MKKVILLGFALTLAIILAACNDDNSGEETEENAQEENTQSEENAEGENEQAQQSAEITEEEKVDPDSAVVSVNGTEVMGDSYNSVYSMLKTQMAGMGQDVSDTEVVKEQTVNVLIEQQLIRQEAEDIGLEVTEEEVQSEFDTLKDENGEQLTTVLEQFQLSEEDFKRQLADDLITNKYVDSELDVEVTDEEVEEYYNQLKEQSGDQELGKLEDLEPTIKDQIKQQKTSTELQSKVAELKEDAEVETLI